MKLYELLTGNEKSDDVEYFMSRAAAIKQYDKIKTKNLTVKCLDHVEIPKPSAKLIFEILNGRGVTGEREHIKAWTKETGEVHR